MIENIEHAISDFRSWIIATVGSGFVWIVRRVLTNQRQIEMLQRDLAAREAMRERDRSDLREVKSDVKELRNLFLERK